MKKLFAVILSFFYLSIATGFSTYSHYCMNRYAGTSLWKKESKNCPFCGMENQEGASHKNSKDCCKNEHKQVKLDKEHQASEFAYQQLQVLSNAIPLHLFIENDFRAIVNLALAHPTGHAPPAALHRPIHILNCVYRI